MVASRVASRVADKVVSKETKEITDETTSQRTLRGNNLLVFSVYKVNKKGPFMQVKRGI
jgi:hypothetical protein